MNLTLFLINLVQLLAWLITVLIIVDIVISYFMSPYHPIRMTIDRIVQPMLAPIRRIVPSLGMIDLSPMVLLILVQVVESLLIGILARMG
jgi:YggT family protein